MISRPTSGAPKQWVEITNCYPPKRQVQGKLRDGGSITVSVFEVPSAFRWPVEGEMWSVERDSLNTNEWILGARIQSNETNPIESMDTGELRLDAESVIDSTGLPFTKNVYVQSTQPTQPGPYLWVQTGLGGGVGWTLWYEDGNV